MEGHSLISTDILASYAAAHHGVRVTNADGVMAVELHVGLDWGASAPAVGAAVQERVAEYLGRMTDLTTATVDVLVDEIGPPPEGV